MERVSGTSGRRCLVLGGGALALLTSCAGPSGAQGGLVPTPAQPEGPYYPRPVPSETDADLTQIAGAPRPAQGDPLLVTGRVLRSDGAPVPGAAIEIWQTDSQGIYQHPNEPRVAQRDTAFQGYGRVVSDAEGRFAFRTVRPGLYDRRTAHIHLRAHPPGGGAALTTQVYFPDEPENARDGLLNRVRDPAQRQALMARLDRDPSGTARAQFDVVLR